MIQNFINIIESLDVTLLEFACIVYIFEHCVFKPVMWFFKKFGGVIIK